MNGGGRGESQLNVYSSPYPTGRRISLSYLFLLFQSSSLVFFPSTPLYSVTSLFSPHFLYHAVFILHPLFCLTFRKTLSSRVLLSLSLCFLFLTPSCKPSSSPKSPPLSSFSSCALLHHSPRVKTLSVLMLHKYKQNVPAVNVPPIARVPCTVPGPQCKSHACQRAPPTRSSRQSQRNVQDEAVETERKKSKPLDGRGTKYVNHKAPSSYCD